MKLTPPCTWLFATKPSNVDSIAYRKHLIVISTAIFAILLHIAFITLFYTIGLKTLALINCISIVIWLFVIRENNAGRLTNAIYLCCFEVTSHAVIAVAYLGLDYGFQYYLWPLTTASVVNANTSKIKSILNSLLCIAIFIFLEIFYRDTNYLGVAVEVSNTVLVANILFSAIPLICVVFAIHSINKDQEARLTKLANIDELTDLYNRRFFNSYLKQYYQLSTRYQRTFCLAMGDLDHFKRINDTYGHSIGDKVLKQVSEHLAKNTRQTDIVCRWGGEEFIILFSDTAQKEVLPVLKKIKDTLPDAINIDEIAHLNITMSFGLTEQIIKSSAAQANNLSNTELINQADALLYQAKNAGRNCIKINEKSVT